MRFVPGSLRVSLVAIVSLLAACATGRQSAGAPSSYAVPPSARGTCNTVADAKAWVRTELYFGTAKPDGSLITEEQYQQFLDTEVTPRFGDGFTLLSARGQFLGANGAIVREPSKVLVLFYSFDEKKSTAVEAIRTAFRRAFQQESVLRADGTACVAF